MAIGDAAIAKGWRLTPGTALAKDIDDEINRVLDLLANEVAVPSRTGPQVKQDLDYLGGRLEDTYNKGTIDTAFARRDVDIKFVQDGNLTTNVYNRVISGNRRALVVQDNGIIGYAASTERHKKFIRPEDVSDESILMLSVVSFQWRAAVGADDRREMGLIAERLVEAGLGWACFYDSQGQPDGINYEMIGVALLPAVQRLIARVSRLEDKENA